MGQSRRILTPLAWVAGTLVLLINGIKLLILNWRLTILQLVPASWVWLAMWDLKRHLLHGDSFAHLTLPERVLLIAAILAFSVLAYWCNTVFAFAIDAPPPPRIAPAMRRSCEGRRLIVSSGLALGAGAGVRHDHRAALFRVVGVRPDPHRRHRPHDGQLRHRPGQDHRPEAAEAAAEAGPRASAVGGA